MEIIQDEALAPKQEKVKRVRKVLSEKEIFMKMQEQNPFVREFILRLGLKR